MSSITINIKPNGKPICLPKDYHHVLQSVFYDLMRDEIENTPLHDGGYMCGKRVYKLFTFGPPTGDFHRVANRLVFEDSLSVEIRTLDEQLIDLIYRHTVDRGVRFGSTVYRDIACERTATGICSEDLIISMQSPLCLYSTDPLSRHTRYIRPGDDVFGSAVLQNFQRKYTAATGSVPDSEISISVIDVRPEDKVVTRYKDFIIEGYKGTYRLKGKSEYLSFLHDTGLGAKNAQGFGMFRVIE